MNPNLDKLYSLAKKKERLIIGLMSGTSLDGLDIALCKVANHGTNTELELLKFETVAYSEAFRSEIKSVFAKSTVDLQKVCLLNPWVGRHHAGLVLECLHTWGYKPDDIDLIASHGQTIYHAPKLWHGIDKFPDATLQIGDGDHLACVTGIITISDFRQKHIAMGGEGAPLAVYGDYYIFSSPEENRIMLNIGGIANFTYLPKSLTPEKVFSTDVGPGNTMMDAYTCANFSGTPYDKNAEIAQKGKVSEELLKGLLDHEFFDQGFPKTTGPELFNLSYLIEAQDETKTNDLSPQDVLATLNKFSSNAIASAIKTCLSEDKNAIIYTSGGGMHNPLLIKNIKEQLPETSIHNLEVLQIDPDAKEAILFAVLANECVAGVSSGFGNSSGTPSTAMGKIS